jgi:AcrR family transcriptional regulator
MTAAAPAPRVQNRRGAGDQLRDELVGAARDLLMTTSEASPFSLRAVAKTVGVSPAAVYRHFASASVLVEAVLVDQNDALRRALEAGGDDPTLVQLGLRYVNWGTDNPGAYQLLFESAERLGHRGGPGTPGWDMIEGLTGMLVAGLGIGEQQATVLAIRAWSSLHGLTSLRIHKPQLEWPTTVDDEVTAIAAMLFDPLRRPKEAP